MPGLFYTDVRSWISWFQPGSLEPLYKFEMLGLLTSLAIYNGLTLPMNFPTALYRKLLDLPVTQLDQIEDGWPELTKGLRELLSWPDGDVEEVFMRSYVFTVQGLGATMDVEMDRTPKNANWPTTTNLQRKEELESQGNGSAIPPQARCLVNDQNQHDFQSSIGSRSNVDTPNNFPSEPVPQLHEAPRRRTTSTIFEPGMVTNANRVQYVEDYIFWLTDKSIRPQFEAFARGFYTCLDRKATTIFTPGILKSVIEGFQDIDVHALQLTTRYEGGYTAEHGIIKDFWHVVHEFSPKRLRQLLEFVTASDRIPVRGVESLLFVIQKNGSEDEVSQYSKPSKLPRN